MKRLLSIFLTVAFCFSFTTINATSGSDNHLNVQNSIAQDLEYDVEAVSKIALFNMNENLLNENSKATDDAVANMGNKLATIDGAEAAQLDLLKAFIRNNTINGFQVSLSPGHGGFHPFTGGGNDDFGNHGEAAIPYSIIITRTIVEDTRGTDSSTGYDGNTKSVNVNPDNAGTIVIADVTDITGSYEVEYLIRLNVSSNLGKFQMAGAYEESFTLTYTDNFGPSGGNQ